MRDRALRAMYAQGAWCGTCEFDGPDKCDLCATTLNRYLDAALAALPTSVVIDGKVVPIFDAEDVAEWAWIAATPVPSRTQGESTIARLLAAAREVAGKERR